MVIILATTGRLEPETTEEANPLILNSYYWATGLEPDTFHEYYTCQGEQLYALGH